MAESLAKKALPGKFDLPAKFEGATPPVEVKPRAIAPYVTFASQKGSLWTKICQVDNGVQDSHQYLVYPDETVVKVTPMKFHVLIAKQFWYIGDENGPTRASEIERPWSKPEPWGENIESVLLVYTDKGIVPACCNFRTTKCGAGQAACRALTKAATAEWAKMGEAYEHTLVCSKPFMRFYGVIQLAPPKTSRRTGFKYVAANATVHPSTTVEWKALQAAFDDKKFVDMLQVASDSYDRRIAEMTALMGK